MIIYEIINEENSLLSGVLLYYEKEGSCIIELPEYLDEKNVPSFCISYVKNGIYTIPRNISFLWVKERVRLAHGRNENEILSSNHLQLYDLMNLLEISKGKSSQDNFYIKKTDRLPDFIAERQLRNIAECVLLDDLSILCFFLDGITKKIDFRNINGINSIEKIITNERVYNSGKVGIGGYFITFNDSIDIPSTILYDSGILIPLGLNDFEAFVKKNVWDTMESGEILNCTRQNISYMVRRNRLKPIKTNVKGNLYLKGNVLQTMW